MSLRIVFVRVGENSQVQAIVTNSFSARQVQKSLDNEIDEEESEKRTVVGFIELDSVVGDILKNLCRVDLFAEGLENLLMLVYNLNRGS